MPASLILSAVYGTMTSAVIALGTMGVAVATFAINFAVSMLVTRLFANGASTQTDNGVRQQVPPSTNNSIPIVYGDAYLGGTFIDAVLTTDQKTMYYVLAVSSISPNGQFTFDRTKMYWADQIITFDGTDLTKVVSLTDGAGNVDTKVNGKLYINLYTSSASGTITSANGASAPSSVMGGSDIDAAYRWTGTRQMNGLAFAIVKLVYSQDAGTTQMQAVTFHVSHYLNSAGSAVPGDVWYDYMTNTVYGGGMDDSIVNSTSRTTLNTYSNATITFTDSDGNPATQPRYRINGVLDTGQNVLSNIDRILIACDCWNQYNAATGQWTAVINKASSTTFAFDDTNIIGEIKVSAVDLTGSINQVEASFPSKLNRDQTDVVFIETPSGLLYPNEPINKYSVTFDLSNDSVQTHYLANRLLEQAREDLIVTINAAYSAIQVDAGDVVSLTNAAYGWTAKLFRVMKITEVSLPDGNLGASLDLNEYNAQVYDDKDITQFSPEPNSGLVSGNYFSTLYTPAVSASRPTAAIPSFDIQVTTPLIGMVTNISLFYTTSASPAISDWKGLDYYSTPNSQPLAQGLTYQFQNVMLPTGTYYFGYIVGNELTQSVLSGLSSAFVWNPTGMTGAAGNSAARAYALYTGNPTVTGSAVVKTGSALPATTDFSPTSATSFSSTVQTPSSGQAMFQSDGIYNPVTNQTTWGTPYLSNLKVGNLSAISADLGTITAGTVTGATIRTAASGGRAEMNSSNMTVYNASGVAAAIMGGSSSTAIIDMVSANAGLYTIRIGDYCTGASIAVTNNGGAPAISAGSNSGSGPVISASNGSITAGACAGSFTTALTATVKLGGINGKAIDVSYGTIDTNGQIVSTLATGTKPLAITSKTKCDNLNAEFWNGFKWGSTQGAGSSTTVLSNPPTGVTACVWLPVIDTGGTTVGYMPIFA